MTSTSLSRSALLMAVIVVISVTCWEIYLRNKGVTKSFDEGGPLWSDKRAMVYEPLDRATVFIGSSRIKFDLDIPTWEAITGDHAIQLAVVGSSPLPALDDLANDKNFKGKLVVDVTEGLFFSASPGSSENPKKYIHYYKDRTPTQRASFEINRLLESQLAFLDKDNFSLTAELDKLELRSRPGVFMMPIFPMEFGRINFDRQETMTPKFLADTNLQNKVKEIWQFFGRMNTEPPASGARLDSFFVSIKTACDKIKARGGEVLFVRTPSSGLFLQMEQKGFPREKYWDKLLAFTDCPGIHYADYPAIAHFTCPEWSHLSPQDAIVFTKNFIEILNKEKGWKFPKLSGN